MRSFSRIWQALWMLTVSFTVIQSPICYAHQSDTPAAPSTSTAPNNADEAQLKDLIEHLDAGSIPPINLVSHNQAGDVIRQEQIYYDSQGNKTRHTCTNSQLTENTHTDWRYNDNGQIEETTIGDGSSIQQQMLYSYNDQGKLSSITKPDGHVISYSYDEADRLHRLHASDGNIDYYYTYDRSGRLTAVEDAIRQTTTWRRYNNEGQLLIEKLANGLTIERSYDNKGRCIFLKLPDSSSVIKKYDKHHLRSIERCNPYGEILYQCEYLEYNKTSQPTHATLINNLGTIEWKYLADGSIKELKCPYWHSKMTWEKRDTASYLTQTAVNTPVFHQHSSYSTDQTGRLISERNSGHSSFEKDYNYDWLENHLQPSATHTTNLIGTLTHSGTHSLEYDKNGNVIQINSADDIYYLHYDALNRLIEIQTDSTTKIVYQYDSFHRLVQRIVYHHTDDAWLIAQNECILYDGCLDIGTYNADFEATALRIFGDQTSEEFPTAIAMELQGHLYLPIHDHLSSITALVDAASRELAAVYHYSAYGLQYNDTIVDPANPWRFAGQRIEPYVNLVLFGQRVYYPDLGRWLTPDLTHTNNACNRYLYRNNRPTSNYNSLQDIQNTNQGQGDTHQQASWFQGYIDRIYTALSDIQEHYGLWDSIQLLFEQTLEKIFPKTYLELTGYYYQEMICDSYGREDLHPQTRVTMINGMGNAHDHVLKTLHFISATHGNTKIHYVFHPTSGWTHDLFYCAAAKCGYISPHAKQLAVLWTTLLEQMGEGGRIYHYAHSIGGTDTNSAVMLMPVEARKKIRVITIGSPTFVIKGDLESVENYASRNDGVPLTFAYLSHLFNPSSHVDFLGSPSWPPLCDHSLTPGGTYGNLMHKLGSKFLDYVEQLPKGEKD
jgi:RHS repeat-associated protein